MLGEIIKFTEVRILSDGVSCIRGFSPEERSRIEDPYTANELVQFGGFPRVGDRVVHWIDRRRKASTGTIVTVDEDACSVAVIWDSGYIPEGSKSWRGSTSALKLRKA